MILRLEICISLCISLSLWHTLLQRCPWSQGTCTQAPIRVRYSYGMYSSHACTSYEKNCASSTVD